MFDFIYELIDIAAAITAVPMAFTLPALFHFKAVADGPLSKGGDLLIIVGSVATSIFCAVNATMNFLEALEKE